MYSAFLAYLLWFVGGFGTLGLHRHYLRKHATGILWFFTGGGFFVGALYDFFTLSRQVRDLNMGVMLENGLRAPQIVQGPLPDKKKPLEQVILETAKAHQGVITPAHVALGGLYNLETCQKELERMAARGFCELRVTTEGSVQFRFPAFTPEGAGTSYAL